MQYWKTQSGKYRIGKYRAWNTNACLPDTNFRPQYVSGTMDIRAYKTDTVTLCDSTAFVVRRSWHYWSCIFRSCIFSAPVFITIDHPASYIILVPSVCVCLYVCMYVCQTITFESLDVGSSLFARSIRVEFVYEGHRVTIKVTWTKKVENSYSHNVKLLSAITPVLSNIEPWCLRAAWGLGTAERTM